MTTERRAFRCAGNRWINFSGQLEQTRPPCGFEGELLGDRCPKCGGEVEQTGPAGATTPTEPTAGPHPFVGRQDRWCEQCHRPDRDPIHAPAGPPDLTDAIQAATDALRRQALDVLATGVPIDTAGVARIAVEAAWPRIRAIHAEVAVLRHTTDLHRELTREQDQTIQRLRTFELAVREAAKCNYDSFGMTQIDKAIAALDQAAPEQEGDDG